MPDIFTAKTDSKITSDKIAKIDIPPLNNKTLGSFMVKPTGIRFETQEKNEEILLLMRQHPITNFGWIVTTLTLLFVPIVFVPFIFNSTFIQQLPAGYLVVLPFIWYLGVLGFAFINFLHWYFNVYIVTNERIVDIDWLSLLYKQLSSTHLDKIQDVTYRQGGVLDSFFDFGNVAIQTAGTDPNFEFDSVPRPEAVVRQIDEMIRKKE